MSKRSFHRKIYQENKKKRKLFFVFKFLVSCFLLFIFCSLFIFIYFAKDFPRPEKFTERQFIQSTKIYDRTGDILLYEIYGEEKRTIVPLEKIPIHLQQAVIVTEDQNFYSHFGIDIKAIVRSVLINFRIMAPAYGGSTIPQQLIRSTFLSTERTAERKIREIVLALELNRRYSKDQILEWYLNQVPFGQNTYGVESASQTYFKKSVSDISFAESAFLAALIRAPYRLSPYGENKDDLINRKDYILNRMSKYKYLTKQESEEAKKEEVKFAEKLVVMKAPFFTLWVKSQLEKKYEQDFLKEKGIKVYTSLNYELQEIAEQTVKTGIERNKNFNAHNAGLIAIEPNTGEILAMTVGTGDYYARAFPEGCISGKTCLFDPQFNVVLGTQESPGRQPGSAFKPFVYATAFKNGYDAETLVIDEETNFGIWGEEEYIPQNYDEKFRGEITLRDALAQSINIPAVKTLRDYAGSGDMNIGLEKSVKTAQDLGISTLKPPYGPSIVLGGWEVKLIDITSAYGVFASNGFKIPPISILKIEDFQGNIIYENQKTPKKVISNDVCKIISDILSDNKARSPMFGLNSALYFKDYSVSAKTGTTQNYQDAWTIGYSSSIVTGVWVGNNNNASMSKEPGVVLAGPIFHSFMEKALIKLP